MEKMGTFNEVKSSITVKSVFENLILMCKNEEVFDIDKEKVLNRNLLPGMMQISPYRETFITWMERRYSTRSNTFARQLRGMIAGQGNRRKLNLMTNALSLSDCYWLKQKSERLVFERISPYFQDFWKGEGHYAGQSVPTLYVNGVLPKYWENPKTLIKIMDGREVYCAQLARDLGIPVANILQYDSGEVSVENFTNPDVMFEAAESSGRIDPEEFTIEDVLRVFGQFGFDMCVLDALVGNGDRHAGNFGFLRDANTGAYLGPAPLFDFDHAYDSNTPNDILIKEVKEHRNLFPQRYNEIINILNNIKLSSYVEERLKAFRE